MVFRETKSNKTSGGNFSFAFVEFISEGLASVAMDLVNSPEGIILGGRRIVMDACLRGRNTKPSKGRHKMDLFENTALKDQAERLGIKLIERGDSLLTSAERS